MIEIESVNLKREHTEWQWITLLLHLVEWVNLVEQVLGREVVQPIRGIRIAKHND